MANCRADLHLFSGVFELKNTGEFRIWMHDILTHDSDLHENGDDYFRYGEDGPLCYELGYENDAEMFVGVATKGKRMNTLKSFRSAFEEAMRGLTDQEYWGDYEIEIKELGDGKVLVAFAVGGNNQW